MNGRNAAYIQAPREMASRNDESGLNLQADCTCSCEKVNNGRGSSEARTDIDEHVRRMHGGLLDNPEQGIDGTRQVGRTAPRKVRPVIGKVAEAKDHVDPGVAVLQRHADERRFEEGRCRPMALDECSNSRGDFSMALVHRRKVRVPLTPCIAGRVPRANTTFAESADHDSELDRGTLAGMSEWCGRVCLANPEREDEVG